MPVAVFQSNPFSNQAQEGLSTMFAYSLPEIVVNTVLATVLGVIIAALYRSTHKGLSYSQSFTQTIVLMSLLVALVMMVIGSNVARAFALVGAL